jgi:hypothetical protein
LCELPAVAVRIGERRGAHAPGSVDWTSEERRAALLHQPAYGIDVVDPEAELEAGPRVSACDRGRLDLLLRGGHVQEIEEQATEFDADGGLVLEDDADGEDVAVELLGRLEILDEETDRADLSQ